MIIVITPEEGKGSDHHTQSAFVRFVVFSLLPGKYKRVEKCNPIQVSSETDLQLLILHRPVVSTFPNGPYLADAHEDAMGLQTVDLFEWGQTQTN